MNRKSLGKKSACLLGAGGLLLGGSCVPDNFWMDTWGQTLRTVVDGVVQVYVVDPLAEYVMPEDGQ